MFVPENMTERCDIHKQTAAYIRTLAVYILSFGSLASGQSHYVV